MDWKVLLGLLISYIVYLCIGGAIFSAIERPPEEEQCQIVQNAVSFLVSEIQDRERNITVEDFQNFTQILQAAASFGVTVDENFNVTCVINWDFQSAFFFSGTVITTIGYGHISPTTSLGRAICILYAIIGIPLFGLMFSGLGDKIAKRIERLEKRIRGRAKRTWVQKVVLILIVLTSLLIFCLLVPAAIFMAVEGWTYSDAFYYSFITITTIGFGDFVVGVNPEISYIPIYRILVYFWILFGIAFMATVVSMIGDLLKKTGETARRRTRSVNDVADGAGGEEQTDGATENHRDDTDNEQKSEDDYEPMRPKQTDTSSAESLEKRPFNQHYENAQAFDPAENTATNATEQTVDTR